MYGKQISDEEFQKLLDQENAQRATGLPVLKAVEHTDGVHIYERHLKPDGSFQWVCDESVETPGSPNIEGRIFMISEGPAVVEGIGLKRRRHYEQTGRLPPF